MRAAGPAWRIATLLIGLGVLAPVATLAVLALRADASHWSHLFAHVLPDAACNTAVLLAGVGAVVLVVGVVSVSTVIGVSLAWLVSAYTFPGRSVLSWMLVLPLAILALPFLDLTMAFLRRTYAGRWWFLPDKQHLHHRLLERGHSQRRAVLLMYV